jgi:hypothetical protein
LLVRQIARKGIPSSRSTQRAGDSTLSVAGALSKLLAGCGVEGCTEAIMKAHGFTVEHLVESLVRSGLASVTPQRVRAGRETVEVATLRITEAGRRVLGQQ